MEKVCPQLWEYRYRETGKRRKSLKDSDSIDLNFKFYFEVFFEKANDKNPLITCRKKNPHSCKSKKVHKI